MKRKKLNKKKEVFGSFRIPLPEKSHSIIRPKKGKGSYKRKSKHRKQYI